VAERIVFPKRELQDAESKNQGNGERVEKKEANVLLWVFPERNHISLPLPAGEGGLQNVKSILSVFFENRTRNRKMLAGGWGVAVFIKKNDPIFGSNSRRSSRKGILFFFSQRKRLLKLSEWISHPKQEDTLYDCKDVRSLVNVTNSHILARTAVLISVTCALCYLRMCINGPLPQLMNTTTRQLLRSHGHTRVLTYLYLPAFNLWLLLCPSTLSYDWQTSSIPLVESPWELRNAASFGLPTRPTGSDCDRDTSAGKRSEVVSVLSLCRSCAFESEEVVHLLIVSCAFESEVFVDCSCVFESEVCVDGNCAFECEVCVDCNCAFESEVCVDGNCSFESEVCVDGIVFESEVCVDGSCAFESEVCVDCENSCSFESEVCVDCNCAFESEVCVDCNCAFESEVCVDGNCAFESEVCVDGYCTSVRSEKCVDSNCANVTK
ncbi:transmembrane and TPR repeat-containing protein 1, partial [Caerostris extrusa]